MRAKRLTNRIAWLAIVLAVLGGRAMGHGDVTPQPVDTTGLDPLGQEWRETNPYRGNPRRAENRLVGLQSELRALPRLASRFRRHGA